MWAYAFPSLPEGARSFSGLRDVFGCDL